jgi:putative phosphoesterase
VHELAAADLIVHAGDFVAESVLEELQTFAPVTAVHGNMDETSLRALLPAERIVEVGETRLGLVHDAGGRAGREPRLIARFPGCAAVVYGHSHLPEITRHAGVWILNPGSPTERRRAPAHTMIRLFLRSDGGLEPELLELA